MKDIKPMPLVTHPQALHAIWLARRLQGAPQEVIERALAVAECPRSLFDLAGRLQQQMGQTGIVLNTFA